MKDVFNSGYVQRGGIGGPESFIAFEKLPPIPTNLDRRYPDPNDPKKTVDYLGLTGVTEGDLAELGLAPMKPAGYLTSRVVNRESVLFVKITGKKSRRLFGSVPRSG